MNRRSQIGLPRHEPREGFPHRVAEHAASGAMRDLLDHMRLSYAPEPLSEGAVFGLSGAFDLRVRTLARAAVPAIDLDGRAALLELPLCRHLGIGAAWRTTADPVTGLAALHDELVADRPALVRADRAELDYRGGGPHDTRHAIVVTGWDRGEDAAWVADGGFPEAQRCSADSLARARASRAWPDPAEHALLAIRALPARLADPRAAVAAALERVVTAMRLPGPPPHPHVRAGLAAADALAGAWPRLPEAAGDQLGATLAAVRFRIRDGDTGGALYRSLQARFLHDAAALLGSRALSRAALVCDDLADAWRAFAESLELPDVAVAHRVAAPWAQRVRALEHEHVQALERHLRARALGAR